MALIVGALNKPYTSLLYHTAAWCVFVWEKSRPALHTQGRWPTKCNECHDGATAVAAGDDVRRRLMQMISKCQCDVWSELEREWRVGVAFLVGRFILKMN